MDNIEQQFLEFYVENYSKLRSELQARVGKLSLSSEDQHKAMKEYGILGNMNTWKYMVDKFMEQFELSEKDIEMGAEFLIDEETMKLGIHNKLLEYGTSYKTNKKSGFESFVHGKWTTKKIIKECNMMLQLMKDAPDEEFKDRSREECVEEMEEYNNKLEWELKTKYDIESYGRD